MLLLLPLLECRSNTLEMSSMFDETVIMDAVMVIKAVVWEVVEIFVWQISIISL